MSEKQYMVLSSATAYSQSPLGDKLKQIKSLFASDLPVEKDLTTCGELKSVTK